ncbi:MAG: diguanylate cyclase [Thermoleophilia bacterium]|nr:diguanylate cyclase [Thermoleophilia bacterium]
MHTDALTNHDSTTHDDAPAAGARRARGGLVGLPARLALLTLAAIVACTAALAGFADHRIQQSARDQSIDRATAMAQDATGQLTEFDFQGGDAEATSQLIARLEQLRADDPNLRSVAVLGGASATGRAATKGSDASDFRGLARRAARSGEPAAQVDGSRVRVAVPVSFNGAKVAGVLALEQSSTDALAAARDSRRKLALGALAIGSALGVLVLLLLRRELFRPLEELRQAMTQVRGGARGVRIGWHRSDELGLVAHDFDTMLDQLEAAEAELARFVNRDPLTGLLTRDAFTDRFSGELTRARREGYPIALLAIDVDDLAEINETHDEHAGDQVLATIGEVISGCTRPTDACGRTGGDSFHVALVGADVTQASVVIQRIRSEIAHRVGVGPERTRVTVGFGVAEYPTHAVDQIALERMAEAACTNAQRQGRAKAVAFGPAGGYVDALSLVPEEHRSADAPTGERELASTVHALARALDGIDPALGGSAHSQRVARYAVAVARELGFSEGQLRELRSAAVLHDVGKVAVPPSILRLPEERLDERQRGALRYHAWVARTMIAGAGLASVADVVFHLPERWDGTGFPERLAADAAPVASRILHAAELLDQLLTGVGDTPGVDHVAAARVLRDAAGTRLDPDVASHLARMLRDGELRVSADADEDHVADAA